MKTQTIKLSGLTCPACKKVTEKRIGNLNGVSKVEVSLNSGVATIDADRKLTILEVNDVLKDTPYRATQK